LAAVVSAAGPGGRPAPAAAPTAVDNPDVIPVNPFRALFSPALWAACVHLLTDGLAALAGLGVLLLIVLSVCLVPVGLVGVPLVGGACWLLGVLGAAERARFAVTLGVAFPAVRRPGLAAALRHPVGVILAWATWRQVGYFLVLGPVSVLTVAAGRCGQCRRRWRCCRCTTTGCRPGGRSSAGC